MSNSQLFCNHISKYYFRDTSQVLLDILKFQVPWIYLQHQTPLPVPFASTLTCAKDLGVKLHRIIPVGKDPSISSPTILCVKEHKTLGYYGWKRTLSSSIAGEHHG